MTPFTLTIIGWLFAAVALITVVVLEDMSCN